MQRRVGALHGAMQQKARQQSRRRRGWFIL
jgi:hypothetical protein